jgi:hypothetical protein
MPLGYNDLKNTLMMPGNIDTVYLNRWRTVDKVGFGELTAEMRIAFALFNQEIASGYYAQYITPTTDLSVEYDMIGDGNELALLSEYVKPDPIRADGTGHMLPMKDYGGLLGWTYLALRRAPASKIRRQIRALIERGRNSWQKALLTRLFKSTYDGVGSTGRSVPFADGGTADSDYFPNSFGGQTFATTHNHFLRYADDAAGRLAAAQAMATHLKEHGLESPYDLVIPALDATAWSAVTGWIKPERGPLITAGIETRGRVSDDYIGLLEVPDGWFQVKTESRLPTDYAGAFKPMGFGAPDNPLAVRYEAGYPMGLSLISPNTPDEVHYPLQEAMAMMTFGVGVNNRVAGVASYFAGSGSYTPPTIS